MAAKKDPARVAMDALMHALDAKNDTYAPGIEVARVDAAELLLKVGGDKERDLAHTFLVEAIEGKIPSLGSSLRTRCAAIVLKHEMGIA